MPKSRAWAMKNSGGMPVIQVPPVALMSPPLRIDSMPSVTTIDGMRI